MPNQKTPPAIANQQAAKGTRPPATAARPKTHRPGTGIAGTPYSQSEKLLEHTVMTTKQTELTPEAHAALDAQTDALNAWLAVARSQLSPAAYANLLQGIANGTLRLGVAAQTGIEGTHVSVAVITTATGRVDQFFEIFLGGEPEDESSSDASTSPQLH